MAVGEAREATPSLPVPSGGLTGSREGVSAPVKESIVKLAGLLKNVCACEITHS